ncbi:class I glutamine amidotransferase-like protein [Aspergillus varians]
MRFSTILTGVLSASLLCLSGSLAAGDLPRPETYGVLLFHAFEMLDVYSPLEALSLLALRTERDLYLIAEILDPVTPAPRPPTTAHNSSFYPAVNPTHIFSNAPDLDVLIIPGGLGPGYTGPNLTRTIDFISTTYPNLQYVITVCTGSALASRAGILDSRRATTNKASWIDVTTNQAGINNTVEWVPKARWVVDGNIWTSSGSPAAIDATLAFIEEFYGRENATWVTNLRKYERNEDKDWDLFAEIWEVPGWDA